MTAEFIHKGKPHVFEVDAEDPPAFITHSARTCPKSPVVRFSLGFAYIDGARQIAVYDVLAFQSE